jgi:hypothetical protein
MTGGEVAMRSLVSMLTAVVVCVVGCDFLDPVRPTIQPDTEVFGNLLDVTRKEDDPSIWIVRVQVGVPRAVRTADEETGNPTPSVEKGLIATIVVGADTVVFGDDRPATLDDIPSGTEVVVIPVSGTTQMLGSTDLHLEAATLMDFATFRRWQLPGLGPVSDDDINDPERINSSGAEVAPVPVAGGTVLYFSAHLRPPAREDESWHGAIRDGLAIPTEEMGPRERSYRTELGDEGWSKPAEVRFPGLDGAEMARVTWMSPDETVCLVTIAEPGGLPWIGRASRSGRGAGWGEPRAMDELGGDASDGVYLTGSRTKVVFSSTRGSRDRSDLFLFDPKNDDGPMPLEPQICTFGSEWNPRTGPQNELFFCREDRQLIYRKKRVQPLRLPGPHRVPLTQAAPTDDGRWVFFCVPKYRPIEDDYDIYVAYLGPDMRLGDPVAVDDWQP